MAFELIDQIAKAGGVERKGADQQRDQAVVKGKKPSPPADWTPQKGCVLLIDEIDKADPDLPNGLLERLVNGELNEAASAAVSDLGRCPVS